MQILSYRGIGKANISLSKVGMMGRFFEDFQGGAHLVANISYFSRSFSSEGSRIRDSGTPISLSNILSATTKLKEQRMQEKYNISLDALALTTSSIFLNSTHSQLEHNHQ